MLGIFFPCAPNQLRNKLSAVEFESLLAENRGKMKGMVLFLWACIIIVLTGAQADAQNPQTSGPPPANLWMTYPVSWTPASDTVAASTRQQRDQFFDESIGLGVPLTPTNVRSRAFSQGVPLPNQQEIPPFPNRSLVIATFDSYQPVLSSSGRSIYTEVLLTVKNVFQDAAGGVTPGAQLVLILNGGTVSTQAGVVLSYLTQRRQFYIKPGSTYLLALSYYSNGNFYQLGKSWDLTDGTAKANFPSTQQTPSTLVGLPVQQLIATLNAQFGIK